MRGRITVMTRRLPLVAALILAVTCAATLLTHQRWIGDWNLTGDNLATFGALGATLAGLPIILDVQRNLVPVSTWVGHAGVPRLCLLLVRRELLPALAAWILVVATAYAATAALNGHPVAASPWPVLDASLGVLALLLCAVTLGLLAPAMAAIPLLLILGFVGPAILATADTGVRLQGLTLYRSVSPELPLLPSVEYYARQSVLLGTVILGATLLAGARLRRTPTLLPAGVAALAVGIGCGIAVGAPSPVSPELLRTTAARCGTDADSATTVCVIRDHERFLPSLLQAAGEISTALPEASRPRTYLELGLDPSVVEDPEPAVIGGLVPSGAALSALADAAAAWQTCDGVDATYARSLWLAWRLGELSRADLADFLGEPDLATADDTAMLAWWDAGRSAGC